MTRGRGRSVLDAITRSQRGADGRSALRTRCRVENSFAQRMRTADGSGVNVEVAPGPVGRTVRMPEVRQTDPTSTIRSPRIRR